VATLSIAILDEIDVEYQSDISALLDAHSGVTKSDIRSAITAVDQWVQDNKISYNNALPLAAKNNLTATQKSRLLTYVIKRRYQEGE